MRLNNLAPNPAAALQSTHDDLGRTYIEADEGNRVNSIPQAGAKLLSAKKRALLRLIASCKPKSGHELCQHGPSGDAKCANGPVRLQLDPFVPIVHMALLLLAGRARSC